MARIQRIGLGNGPDQLATHLAQLEKQDIKRKKQLQEKIDKDKQRKSLVKKATILYLIGKKAEHYMDLKDSLRCLTRYFLERWPYPVMILHEGLTIEQVSCAFV